MYQRNSEGFKQELIAATIASDYIVLTVYRIKTVWLLFSDSEEFKEETILEIFGRQNLFT